MSFRGLASVDVMLSPEDTANFAALLRIVREDLESIWQKDMKGGLAEPAVLAPTLL